MVLNWCQEGRRKPASVPMFRCDLDIDDFIIKFLPSHFAKGSYFCRSEAFSNTTWNLMIYAQKIYILLIKTQKHIGMITAGLCWISTFCFYVLYSYEISFIQRPAYNGARLVPSLFFGGHCLGLCQEDWATGIQIQHLNTRGNFDCLKKECMFLVKPSVCQPNSSVSSRILPVRTLDRRDRGHAPYDSGKSTAKLCLIQNFLPFCNAIFLICQKELVCSCFCIIIQNTAVPDKISYKDNRFPGVCCLIFGWNLCPCYRKIVFH